MPKVRQEVTAYKWFRWWSQSTPNDQQFLYSEFAGRREERAGGGGGGGGPVVMPLPLALNVAIDKR